MPNFSFENPASSSDDLHSVYGDNLTTTYIQDWSVTQQNNSTMGTMNYAADGTDHGGIGPARRLFGYVVRVLCDFDDVGKCDEQ